MDTAEIEQIPRENSVLADNVVRPNDLIDQDEHQETTTPTPISQLKG